MGNQRCIFFQPIIKWVKIECKQLHYNDDNKNRAINSSYAHQNSRYDILIIPFTFIIVLCWVICDYFVLFYFCFLFLLRDFCCVVESGVEIVVILLLSLTPIVVVGIEVGNCQANINEIDINIHHT